MATGIPPFGGATIATISDAILNRAVQPPSQLNHEIPHELDRVILGALEKDRELRVQSAAQLRAELLRLRRDGSAPIVAMARPRRSWPLVLTAAFFVIVAAASWFVVAQRRRATPALAQEKRLAVLPFENLGGPEDNYFADGMTDEVRGKLAGLHGLAVIARASSDQYKGTRKSPREIAQELGAPYLVTGKIRWDKSVQPSRIRLSPELVEISDKGAPVARWQDNYDAALANVFAVQGQIATQVARSLEVALGVRQTKQLEQRPTSNLAAYDAYLKGVEIFSRGFSSTIDRDAAAQFERAVALDPNFAMAWAYLSLSHSMRYAWGSPTPEISEGARVAAEKALALSPELPKAHMALGVYERVVTHNTTRAAEVFRHGLEVAPENVDLLRNLGYADRELGKSEEALVALRRTADLDPRSWQNQLGLAEILLFLHRPHEARDAADRGLALNPANSSLVEYKVFTYLAEGDVARARAIIADPPPTMDATALVAQLASYCVSWAFDEQRKELLLRLTPAAFDNRESEWALSLADAYWLNGKSDKARKYAEQAQTAYQDNIKTTPTEPMLHAQRAHALAILGRTGETVSEGTRALELAKNFDLRGRVLRWLSRAYVVAGDEERTISTTERLLKSQTLVTPAWLRIDPHYASMRDNRRFQALMR
jgi:TolB-like protein/Tfp pilus assembly protein PilF